MRRIEIPARYEDWLKQAEKDLKHAKKSLEGQDFEWSCLASQQSAEKAIKAVYQKINADAWGHFISALLANLQEEFQPLKKST